MITIRDRRTQKLCKEKVYGETVLELLYGNHYFGRTVGRLLRSVVSRFALFSHLYGWWQERSLTRWKIDAFVKQFEIDTSEFAKPLESFSSFQDFFIRTLLPSCRLIDASSDLVIPADGRYLAVTAIGSEDLFQVKGHHISLGTLLQNQSLAAEYAGGTMVLARLAPVDCHRVYFPCGGRVMGSWTLPGPLFSVNPIAIGTDGKILMRNKRVITRIASPKLGSMLLIEVGATHVGSIRQTYPLGKVVAKGDEKSFFSFGGSALILLFEKNRLYLSDDLLASSKEGIELLCQIGQPLGHAFQAL